MMKWKNDDKSLDFTCKGKRLYGNEKKCNDGIIYKESDKIRF